MTMKQNVILEVNCKDIDWEVFDCETCKQLLLKEGRLPKNLTIRLEDKISYFKKKDKQQLEDLISEEIFKKCLFLHNSFSIKSIKFKTKYPITPTEDDEIFDLKKNIETKFNLQEQFKITSSYDFKKRIFDRYS